MRYDAHGALYYQQDVLQENNQSVTYTKHMVGGFEKKTRSGGVGSLTEYRYTVADDVVIVQRQSGSNHSEATYFLFKDHLGSVFTTLASTGEIISQQLFSAFGQTRTIYTAGGVALGSMLPPTEQGFTGHRQMDALGIVHMKGRIYDPTLGRFLQADPFVQEPKNSQNYNRYSYVLNNPMSYTDPSGYFFSKLWETIKPIIGAVVVAVLSVYCQACATYFASSWYGAATAGAIAGAAGAAANGGNIFTGALRGAVAAATFYGVGQVFEPGSFGHLAGRGLAGGVMSDLYGGKFGHGFWSAGLGNASSGQYSTNASTQVIVSAVVGGTISKLTGGKFANGAFNAAFARALGEARASSSRYRHSRDEGIVDEGSKADNSVRAKINLSNEQTTLSLDISNELRVLIDGLESDPSTFANAILGEFGSGNHSAIINADYSLTEAGIYDPKTKLITINPIYFYGKSWRAQLILGHELIHLRDGAYTPINVTEINAYSWEKRALLNYYSLIGNPPEYKNYKDDIEKMIEFYGGN